MKKLKTADFYIQTFMVTSMYMTLFVALVTLYNGDYPEDKFTNLLFWTIICSIIALIVTYNYFITYFLKK